MIQQVHLFNTENYEERPFSIFSIEDQDWTAEVKQMKFSADGQFIGQEPQSFLTKTHRGEFWKNDG